MEKSREQFEGLARNNGLPLDVTGGCYSNRDTRMAWDAWKASRESLEVKLPDGFGVHEVWCYPAHLVENELINIGVKIK